MCGKVLRLQTSKANYTLFTPYDMLYSPDPILIIPRAQRVHITPAMILSEGSFKYVGSSAPIAKADEACRGDREPERKKMFAVSSFTLKEEV